MADLDYAEHSICDAHMLALLERTIALIVDKQPARTEGE